MVPFAAVVFALTLVTASAPAQAEEFESKLHSDMTTVYTTSLAAGGDAARYSDAPNTIGVVVYYGPDVDPIYVGDAFVKELRSRGMNARAFAAPINGEGASILYQIGDDGLGPLGVNSAAANMSQAITKSHERDLVLSPEYAPVPSGQ
jgi:hypothetical protein